MIGRIVLLVFLTAAVSTSHADLIENVNGASPREREIRWLWKYLGEFIHSCSKSKTDCAEVRDTVLRLKAEFPAPGPAASPWGRRLKFVSEKQFPDLFKGGSQEAHRVAMTEARKGADVYVNTDRMDGLSLSQWVGVLVHESVHHLGIDDDASRTPDRVGAAVASHVQKNWHGSDMLEFGHNEAGIFSFSDPAGDKPARIFVQIKEVLVDLAATPNSRVPICKPGERFQGQTMTGAPLWRVAYLRGDQARAVIRGSARIKSFCADTAGKTREEWVALGAIIHLQFAAPFDPKTSWWELPSKVLPDIAAGVTDGQEAMLDGNRTFAIESVKNEKAQVRAGETWKTRIIVTSLDAFAPKECSAYFSASKWFFQTDKSTAMFEFFNSCLVTPLGSGRFQVDAEYTFPKDVQPDVFSLFTVFFPGANEWRFAIPAKPQFVEVMAPAARPRLEATGWRTVGLSPRASLEGAKVENSFRVEYGKPFWLEVDFRGTQTLKRQFFDFVFAAVLNGKTLTMPWNPPLENIKNIVIKQEVVPIPGGFRVRYQIVMPRVTSDMPVTGFKLKRISVETDDLAWSELEIPNLLEAWFLTDSISP